MPAARAPARSTSPQAVAASVQSPQTGAVVGSGATAGLGPISAALGAAMSPAGIAAAGAPLGAEAGRITGASVGFGSNSNGNTTNQLSGWLR